MPIKKTNFDGDSNLGLHATATQDFCVMDPSLSRKCYRRVKETLDVKTIRTSIANSRMSGIFCAANSNGVALPKNAGMREKTALEEQGIDWKVIKTELTALGNLILVNDETCAISPRLEDAREELESCFDVSVVPAEIGGLDLLGASAVVTNLGLLSHRDTSSKEMEKLEEVFNLECGRGTVNFGKPFVGASTLANSEGVLTGTDTTGPELGRLREALLATK